MKIAFIGLGVMGYPMAGHLQNAGHDVVVFNRTASKAAAWVDKYHGERAPTPYLAATNADLVLMCVGNDDDVRSVVYGDDGVLSAMSAETILIDHTTTSALLAEELSVACTKSKVHFLDAPVSGGQAGADNALLTIMTGGEASAYERALPVLDIMAKKVTLVGGVGAGQKCKMVNQLCIAGLVQGLAEGINFAKNAGLDEHVVLDVLRNGAAQSWQLENRTLTMAQGKFDFGFAIDWMRKDLSICFEEAERNGSLVPIAKLVDGFYAELQNAGEQRSDTSVLIKRLAKS
ncbi:NAD(P)-dependent oxidoreductase [Moritella marina ATCC 15381]|uniref:NAD(P)-dependent oxidoreductase n=1 Tax=Moritella marina ATCC 15381 TaxID=1202962 RepID=A0A5J6WS88_MORMI|nr:NAD(P)-dependent oxidoreductase [Moritella marina]QFI39262.1 NAD(P)-dependent oxidoreductase [Moritella marina ATCC 15381]